MGRKLSDVANLIGGKLVGDGDIEISGASGLREAHKGEITFLANKKYIGLLDQTHASAVICPTGLICPIPAIFVANPDSAFAKVVGLFAPPPINLEGGIHKTALIGEDVLIGKGVSIGAYCVIESKSSIGNNTTIYPNVYIGHFSKIGSDCLIYPRVVIRERIEIGNRVIIHPGTVIGSDGFGYATIEGVHHKIPQVGNVAIEDDVEIGANCTIDRARFDKTIIRSGTKIDNLVHIAHNVEIGQRCIIAAQTGIAGSTKLGKYVVLGGQVGIIGHLNIGDRVMIGAQAGVGKDIKDGEVVSGSPAKDHKQQLREYALLKKLPQFVEELKNLNGSK